MKNIYSITMKVEVNLMKGCLPKQKHRPATFNCFQKYQLWKKTLSPKDLQRLKLSIYFQVDFRVIKSIKKQILPK